MNRTDGLTHRSEYEDYILRFLKQNGGQATISEVMKYIGEQMKGKFTAADLARKTDRKNMLNWEYAVHWSRTKLKNEGKIITGDPRGVWKLKK